jgi:hypothetical protein
LSSATGDLTAILARAADKSRQALDAAQDEAQAWLEEVRGGAHSDSKECVTCGAGPPLEDNHVAGRRHGDLTVPNCLRCHRRFTEGQDLWDPRSLVARGSPALDQSLLLRGLYDLLVLRAECVPGSRSGAYLALAESVREQYLRAARGTL